jgi:hypothetical protein
MRWGIVAIGLIACSGDKTGTTGSTGETGTPTTQSTGPATLTLDFHLDPDLIPTMSEAAAGTFEGSIYAEADASAIGPNGGAVPLLDFSSDPLTFGADGVVLAGGTAGPIDAQIVWILGCLDTTGDGCECGDPITIPNENKLQILPGDGTYSVTMSLLDPEGC